MQLFMYLGWLFEMACESPIARISYKDWSASRIRQKRWRTLDWINKEMRNRARLIGVPFAQYYEQMMGLASLDRRDYQRDSFLFSEREKLLNFLGSAGYRIGT